MQERQFEIINNKIIIRIHDKICENSEELLSSQLFRKILELSIEDLSKRSSYMLDIFDKREVSVASLDMLVRCLRALASGGKDSVSSADCNDFRSFLKNVHTLNDFIEFLYNFWRRYDRIIMYDAMEGGADRRPYRTFNATVGHLTHLIRGIYRDIQENITGDHPRIYREVAAGAELATISVSHEVPIADRRYDPLHSISVIRQILLNPPLILNPSMNKRKGEFVRVNKNPIECFRLDSKKWLCYPAKVGSLIILIYVQSKFIDLGLSLCNLFELATDGDLTRKPDAIFFFGVPGDGLDALGRFPTVFYEDQKNDLLVGAVPDRDEFGYFGYLKKMVLTLHNVAMLKQGKFPFHGALIRIVLRGNKDFSVLVIGDTGAGKSEMLEAFRELGEDLIQDLIIVADDMGSIEINEKGDAVGYGTEIGAFLRLDDLRPGYALGQIDRAIIMSASQVNARIILPVTSFDTVVKGHKIDYILYANNYESIDNEHPAIERFEDVKRAFHVFREGTVMSKGTTASTGIVHSYFANIFGPPQYKELHEKIALEFFNVFFKRGIFVGQIRTRLGLKGYEQTGPHEAAKALLDVLLDG